MKKLILIVTLISSMLLMAGEKQELEHLNLNTFKEKVFDYEKNTEWNFIGELPVIIDFYADWCGPCKTIAPIMVELAEEYEGRLVIYKIDTEDQRELAGMFGISSIPSILFIPVDAQPQMSTGALPKSEFVRMIKEILKVE